MDANKCTIEKEVMEVPTYGQLSPPEIPGPISTNSICECLQTLSRFSCESLAPRD